MRSRSGRIDLVADRARAAPGALALVDLEAGARWTWGELDRATSRAADRLLGLGVRRGDRVAIAAPAGAAFAAALHGAIRIGASVVPLDGRQRPPELGPPLAGCSPRIVLAEGAGAAAAVVQAWPGDGGRVIRLEAVVGEGGSDHTAHGAADAAGEAAGVAGLAPDDELCVIHTSGTTGPPKGVRLTLGNQLASAAGCAESLRLGPSDHWLLALAPHHVGGFAVLVRGAALGQPVSIVPRFREAAVLGALAAGGPTVLPVVPTMLSRLVAAGGTAALGGLRAILLGGAPAPAQDLAAWVGAGLPVHPSYGLTETGSQVATAAPALAGRLGPVAGRPHRFARVRILAEDGSGGALPRGRPGRIEIRGPVVSPGYVGAAAGDGGPTGGRFLTRDRGLIGADGVLRVLGRADDAILSGGETVHPAEVEAVLARHPLVRDLAVVGVPDRLWGQRVVAVVVADPGAPPGLADDLSALARQHLSGARIPRAFLLADRLPRSAGGKLLRRRLSERVRRADR